MNCPNCGLKFSDPAFVSQTTGTCPNCGHAFSAAFSPSRNPISQYFDDLKSVLLKPRSFFRRMPRNGGLSQPLAFALIAHWLGSAVGFLWNSLAQRTGDEILQQWLQTFGRGDQIDMLSRSAPWLAARHAFAEWFWGAGSVIIDPFTTLLSLLVTSFFVFLGARLLAGAMSDAPFAPGLEGSRHEITFESAVRIMSYGAVASIFRSVPWVGGLIAVIYGIYISFVGAKEVYSTGNTRSLAIVLFPKLLVLGLVIAMIAVFALFAVSFFTIFMGAAF